MSKLGRKAYYWLRALTKRMPAPSGEVAVDVVIPVVAKDLKILPLSLQALRRNVNHNIGGIYIVANGEDGIVPEFCRENGVTFVEERSVLGYGPKDIHLLIGSEKRDRSGWLFQQLLKLSGVIGQSDYFITIDADHILLRPHTFVTRDDKSVFYQSCEHHQPYFDNMKRLLNRTPDCRLSYVSHKMVFNRDNLKSLREEIERKNPGKTWDRAIIDSVDRNQVSGFSEFELYGNFTDKSRKILMPTLNHHLGYASLGTLDDMTSRYGLLYRSITFPDYKS